MMDQIKQNISKKLLSDSSVMNQMQGEFSIIKNYGGDMANLFAVNNPHKPRGQDHYVYTITVNLNCDFMNYLGSRFRGNL